MDVFGQQRYHPMYDETYESARQEGLDGLPTHKPEERGGLDY